MAIRPARRLLDHRHEFGELRDGLTRRVEDHVVGAPREPQHRVVLRGRHQEPVLSGQGLVEPGHPSWGVIGRDLSPELWSEPRDEVHSSHRRPRLAEGRDSPNEVRPLAFVSQVEFEVGVGCRS